MDRHEVRTKSQTKTLMFSDVCFKRHNCSFSRDVAGGIVAGLPFSLVLGRIPCWCSLVRSSFQKVTDDHGAAESIL